MNSNPPGIRLVQYLYPTWRQNSDLVFKTFILISTFLAYTSFHLSRKPISIVKNSQVFLDCAGNGTNTCTSWIYQIDGKSEESAKMYLGLLDTTYLFSYAFFMFISGFVAERSDLRLFLSFGMIMSGVMTFLFGVAFNAGIRSIWYFLFIQLICGMFQSSGWPGVVTVVANWFGEGRRGLMFGVWNSHTSLGNILGSLIAGAFVLDNWGLSFIIPSLVIGSVGFLVFLFLPPTPESVGLNSPGLPERGSDCEATSSIENTPLLKNDPDVTTIQNGAPAISFFGALKIPGVVEFSLCLFCAKLVSYTFLYWLPKYINSTTNLDAKESAILSTLFDIGGVIGGIFAGVISDYSGMKACTCASMLIFAIPSMFIYQHIVSFWCPIEQLNGIPIYDFCFFINLVVLIITGFLVNGPYCLITTAVSAELGTHQSLLGSSKALATVTAIIDGTGSVGAAVGPLLAGWLSGTGNWDNVFVMLMVSNVGALFLLVRLIKGELERAMEKGEP